MSWEFPLAHARAKNRSGSRQYPVTYSPYLSSTLPIECYCPQFNRLLSGRLHVSVYIVMEDEGVTSVVVHTKFVYDVPIDAHYNMILYINVYLPPSLQPCITAQDLSWHQEHFVCSRCNTDLSQCGYTAHNNRDAVCVHVCMCVYISKLPLPPSPPPPPSLSLSPPPSLPLSLR